ncbi:Asp-tRNA(Asn)/Glu-tRNA(Gln) amidotransferase subunit GatB [Clostridia bacterium]|nr:Asp-tRNA(Asn)/Glu-tRNA(Gln) amidotransferase subunit GatB [Clostridia bacterium]
MTQYEAVIGLEVHVELKTKTKIFCSCSTEFGGEPNTHVCPVCLGLPGVLPVLNKQVVEFGIRTGLALNAHINGYNKFDRKNYYYPDLSKNFQTSQFDQPICEHGSLAIELEDGRTKVIGITRAHMEEDAGKLVHNGNTIMTSSGSLVDYNRVGVPLLEIVSEPDIRSSEEARAYVEELRKIIRYIDVSDCKMEEGSLRVDANVSVRPVGREAFGTRTETKNMNSFKALERAIDYEISRQIEVIEAGGVIVQETRTWDDAKGITLSMRSKEEAHDYRYFPEPDLAPIVISDEWIEKVKNALPALPAERRKRLISEDGLSAYDAMVITDTLEMAEFYDGVRAKVDDPKTIANVLMGDFSKALNAKNIKVDESKVSPKDVAELIKLMHDGTISGKIAKQVIPEMVETGKTPKQIVEEKGLVQVNDEGAVEAIVEEVLAANPQSVADYKGGKGKAIGFLVGQVMKASRGKANPGLVNKILKQKLDA